MGLSVLAFAACAEPTRVRTPPAMEKVDVPGASSSAPEEPTTDLPIGDAGAREGVGNGPTKIGGQGPEVATPSTDGGDAPSTPSSPPATKAAQVLTGPPQVSGALGADVVDRTVHARLPRLKLCYEAALKRASSLEGTISISFVVTKAGGVRSPNVAGGSLSDKPLGDCMTHQFSALVFPRPKAESTVILPLTLVAPRSDAGHR